MCNNDPWSWKEGKIWNSILDPNFWIHPEHNADLFEWWEDKVGIIKEEYVMMDAAQLAIEDNAWDESELNEFSKERIECLDNILKRPDIHTMQKKVAKILRDRLKAKVNDEKYGSAGWLITGEAVGNGDIDLENLK